MIIERQNLRSICAHFANYDKFGYGINPKRNLNTTIIQHMKKTLLPILLATIWIGISEFVRNEFLLKSYWTGHYEDLGLIFPTEPINGAVWGIWSLCLAIAIFIMQRNLR